MTILCDSVAKYMSGIRNTVVQSFPGINISQMKHVITSKQASIKYKYTILLVGTNNLHARLTRL